MADAENRKNELLLSSLQLRQDSISGGSPWPPLSPWASAPDTSTACGESAAGDISDTSLRKIQIVAEQLVMNSPDRQRSLIRPHLRASVPPYDSPDSCPPPPNNTPDTDSSPSNTSNRGCTSSVHTPCSIVKVLKPPERSANWILTPAAIYENTPIGMHGLAPPGSSSHWTATPVSMMSSPGSISDSIPSNTPGTLQNTGGNFPGSASSQVSSSSVFTPGDISYSTVATPCSNTSSFRSPLPSIVVTPPAEEYSPSSSFVLSTPDTPFSPDLNCSGIPRLRSDSEGSVSSILSISSAMLKLIDSSLESKGSSLQGTKDVQSDMSSDMESPNSVTSKSSSSISPKDICVKKDKDLRKKLLQNLMSAEVTKREEELLKKHNVKLMESKATKRNRREQRRVRHVQPTCGSTPVKLIILIIFLAVASFVVAWLFTDLIGPLQKRILVGDYDSLDAGKEPHRLPWIPDNEEIGSIYKYGSIKGVLTKKTPNIISEVVPFSTVNDNDEKQPSVDYHNFEGSNIGILDPSIDSNDLHIVEEIDHVLEIVYDEEGISNINQLAIEEEIENEYNDISESSDSDELDDGIESDKEVSVENMKPTILKLIYYNIRRSHANGDVNIKGYTTMYFFLNNFLTTFGSFATTQSKMLNDRIRTLEKLMDHNINYAFASTMIKYEIESGLIDEEFPISGSMIFTCLHRHLQYLQEALENIIKIQPSESLFVAFRTAYDDTLAYYHHWFVEKFYLLGLSSLPTKENALQKLNKRFVEISSMDQLSNGLKLIIEQLQELNQFTEVLLNKYNVTQMIPAQVIT